MNKRYQKPSFYDSFVCTADQCEFTCCQQWKIGVDDKTWEKWWEIPSPIDETKKLKSYTTKKDGQRVIRLNSKGVCPFLNENKLCKLVLTHGDEILSKTCQTFPREIHRYDDFTEYTLMPSCPAVLDFLETWKPGEFISAECEEIPTLIQVRDFLIGLISDREYSVSEALLVGFYLLLEWRQKAFDLSSEKAKILCKDVLHQVRRMEKEPLYTMEECSELILDLSVDYRKQKLYTDILEPLCERVEEYLEDPYVLNTDRLRKTEPLFRALLAEEFFADLCQPEGTFETLLLHYEWIVLVFAAVRQAVLLMSDEEEEADLDSVKKLILVFSRMTGYEEEDIFEYLEECFEAKIWEWGYLALIAQDLDEK